LGEVFSGYRLVFTGFGALMPIYAVFVINRSGGLIYHAQFHGAQLHALNECLRLASTLHGIQHISRQVSPVENTDDVGLIRLEARTFRLRIYQPPTGIQFVTLSTPDMPDEILLSILRRLHLLYADYALKNPFYVQDMPIRCRLFDIHFAKLMKPHIASPMR
jgi:hypothetical protein